MAGRRLPLVIVLGATGAGKSNLALEIAKVFKGEIISADSMQIYKGLNIITNKVTDEEQTDVKHHMISYLNADHKHYTVVDFKTAALPIIEELLKNETLPVICGGTNYYIESLLWDFTVNSNTQGDGKRPSEATTDKLLDDPTSKKSHLSGQALTEYDATNKLLDELSGLSNEKNALTDRLQELDSSQLHRCLSHVDPESAAKKHPKDTRKVIRALQYFLETGATLSSAHSLQHQGQASVKSGPLRYPDPCILWVKCDQPDLDSRLDKRVDAMIERGVIKELEDFAQQAQHLGSVGGEDPDSNSSYPFGFLQNIGFKEFHKYLQMTPQERETLGGKAALQEGITNLKQVTRRYARQQVKWIQRRFCSRPGANVPPVYTIDSTDKSKWPEAVSEAVAIVQAFCDGQQPDKSPEVPNLSVVQFEHNVCTICEGKVFLYVHDWCNHLKSKGHRYNVKKMNKERTELFKLIESRKQQLESTKTD